MAIIISASSGFGKTQHRLELMSLFNCSKILDSWDGTWHDEWDDKTLVLTNVELSADFKAILVNKGHTIHEPKDSMGPFVARILESQKPNVYKTDDDNIMPNTKAEDRQISGTHYKDMKIQPWTLMKSYMTREEYIGYQCGTVLAYIMRHKAKGGEQDLHKAAHHMQELSEYLNAVV